MNRQWVRRWLGACLCVSMVAAHADDADGQHRAQKAGKALIGTRAPRLVLTTVDGATIDLGNIYGKQAVYLKFWATWCVPCRQQMPHFEHVYETAGPDLAVVAIDTGFNDSVVEVQKTRKQLGLTMPIVVDDGQAGAAFHLRVTPQHIVIGRDGRILYVGHLADARLDAALAAARSAKPLPPAAATVNVALPSVVHYQPGEGLSRQWVRTIDGQTLALGDPEKRRLTVLAFLSPWCESYLATTRPELSADCRAMREQINAVAVNKGVRWIGIASGLWATAQRPARLPRQIRRSHSVVARCDGRAFSVLRCEPGTRSLPGGSRRPPAAARGAQGVGSGEPAASVATALALRACNRSVRHDWGVLRPAQIRPAGLPKSNRKFMPSACASARISRRSRLGVRYVAVITSRAASAEATTPREADRRSRPKHERDTGSTEQRHAAECPLIGPEVRAPVRG